MRRFLFIALAAVLAGGFLAWWLSPGQVVKRRTEKLMSTLTMEEGSGGAARHLNTLSLGNLIADEISLETPTIGEANGEFQRADINSGFSWLTTRAKFTKFAVEEFVKIEVSGDTAFVEAKVLAEVELQNYRPADGLYDVEFNWHRTDDGWQLARARWMESR